MADEYLCNGPCGRKLPRRAFHERATHPRRPVASWCRECRSLNHYLSRYDTVCAACLRPRPIDSNGVCRRCNSDAGLKQCRGPCGLMRTILLDFWDGKSQCITCLKARRAPAPGAALRGPPARAAGSPAT